MLKWFRKYNSIILAIGVSMLMIAFLLPGALTQFGRGGGDYAIGTIGADKLELMFSDQQQAGRDVETLQRLFTSFSPIMSQFAGIAEQESMPWLLMKHEADAMGLSVGPSQVNDLLRELQIDDPQRIEQITRNLGISEDYLYAVLADWIMIQQYKELVLGREHWPVIDRLRNLDALLQQYVDFQQQLSEDSQGRSFQMQYFAQLIALQLDRLARRQGRARVSKPAVLRLLVDNSSRVTVKALRVSADRYLEQVPDADEAKLAALFEQYKDNLPGTSDGYGLGYFLPDRVKCEYLAIPFERVVKVTKVDESEAVDYYDANRDQFVIQPEPVSDDLKADDPKAPDVPKSTEPVLKSYVQARDQIIGQLRDAAAEKLSQQIANAARALLTEDLRPRDRKEGYFLVPDEWTPLSLEVVAQQIQKDFGVLPDVKRLDDRWLDAEALEQLGGIGQSSLWHKSQRTRFIDYVMSVKELDTQEASALRTLALQVHSPSHVLQGYGGSRFLFRLIDAQPAHRPESLAEVRATVVADARRLAAYQMQLDDVAQWRKALDEADWADLAEEWDTQVIEPRPFSRRESAPASGKLEAAQIDQIGRDAAFVDAVFELAQKAASSGQDFKELPASQRSAALQIDAQMALYLVRIEKFEPITPSQYALRSRSPTTAEEAEAAIIGTDVPDPLSYEAIQQRVGFIEAGGG